ncbi:MAG TPA: hypothetical protein VMN79_15365 [Casimicrobiaceae bacterium]|nr:hypothetical protein [Casimicrobiaceae bacterium]
MEAWETILLAFGGNAALIAVLAVIAKSFLEKLIVRDTKRFEAELKAKADVAIENLKSELQLKAIEHQVRFSRLHEKPAVVIADLYGHLVEALWEAESFLSPMEWAGEPNKKEKHATAMNKLVDLYRYFDKNRIYLPGPICDSLEKLGQDVRMQVIKFGVWVRFDDRSLTGDSQKQKTEAWDSGWNAIKNQIPLARTRLEEEFRLLLGATANPGLNADAHRRAFSPPAVAR